MPVSSLEQDISCRNEMGEHFRLVFEKLEDPVFTLSDCLRLVCLYSLRYETNRGNRVRSTHVHRRLMC
jgi:hypothetical protein